VIDAISQERLAKVHPELARRVNKCADLLDADGIHLRVTQGFRTWVEQTELYRQGRTTPGILCTHDGLTRPIGTCWDHPMGQPVTKAKAGQSMHNFGLACDAVPDIPDLTAWYPDWSVGDVRWTDFLAKAKSCGLAEGAAWRSFPDAPHLYPEELPANPDENMITLFNESGIEAVWAWASKQMNLSETST